MTEDGTHRHRSSFVTTASLPPGERHSLPIRTITDTRGPEQIQERHPPPTLVGALARLAAYPVDDPIDPVDVHAMGLDPASHWRDHLGRPWPLSTGKVIGRLV